MDNEAFDNYMIDRCKALAAEIRAKLAAGDAELVGLVDDHIGVLLFDSKSWASLIQSTAQGKPAFAEVMDKAIEAIAECRALMDAEQAEKDREQDAAESRYEQIKDDRAYLRSVMYH